MSRITIVSGHTGVGKSECSVALAHLFASDADRRPLTVIDLDVVNPYFRSREARARLEGLGATVVGNAMGFDSGVDLPAIPGTIAPALRDPNRRVLIDLGGDSTGARALRQFRAMLPPDDVDILHVVNVFRPRTRDATAIVDTVLDISKEIGRPATALVNNSHMLHETEIGHVARGAAACALAAEFLGIPVAYAALPATLLVSGIDAPPAWGAILPIGGALREAWMAHGNHHLVGRSSK